MSNEIIEHEPNSNQQPEQNFAGENEHRKYTFIVYGLYVASFFVLPSIFVGVIIAYIKRNETYGTVDYSHMQYLIRTFWVTLIGVVVGTFLIIIGIGWLILLATVIWFAYRLIMGVMRLLDNQEVNPYVWF
ncbi:MAG: hypothetical protein IKN18_05400 [Neisseriaceae bacterium]|nr:hypothetical protein [Neisseriaceae bacterium]